MRTEFLPRLHLVLLYLGGFFVRRGPAVFLLFCLLFSAAYGAWRAGQEGYARLTDFAPPHFAAERTTAGPMPLAGRLVLIMIEGLRTEEIQRLPSLEWVHQQGASYQLRVPGPSHQPAAAASLLTGAPPTLHGMLGAQPAGPLKADNLVQAALRAKVTTGGAGGPTLGQLTAGSMGTWYEGVSLSELAEGTHSLLAPGGPKLVLIEVNDLAAALDRLGPSTVDSVDYRDALARLDAGLVSLLDQIDWKSTAVMVSGVTPRGPLGQRDDSSPVPLLLAGSGVVPGARGEGSLLDVAPTATALLGLPTPMQVQGWPLTGALQVEGRPADAIMQTYLTARQAYTRSVLQSLGSALTPAGPPATAAEAADYVQTLEQQIKAAGFERAKASILARLPYLGSGALVLLVYLLIVYRQPFGGAVLLGHALYAALFHSLFFLIGGRYGTTMLGLETPLTALRLRFGLVMAGSLLLAMIAAGMLLSRREVKRINYVVTSSLHLCLSLAAAVALPVGVGVLLVGWEFPIDLPAPGLSIWFLLTVMHVMVIGGLSPVWAWAAVRGFRFARRRWPLKEVGNPEVNADKVVRLKALRQSSKHGRRG